MKSLIVYSSYTGNTKKVAEAIAKGLRTAGAVFDIMMFSEAAEKGVSLFDYDLVYCGSPSFNWMPSDEATGYLKAEFAKARSEGKIQLGAPKIGKHAVLFCTYSGIHTGINEAIPVNKYMGQFFEHFGFTVDDEWYILSEFINKENNSINGKLGDLRGLPTERELARISSQCFLSAQNYMRIFG